MKYLALFTLQGLGNSILALPVLLSLKSRFQVTLYLMNEPAYRFYSDLNLGIEVVFIKNLRELLTKTLIKSDIAVSLYPNWRREFAALWRCPAKRKISFEEDSFRFSRFLNSIKIHREAIHDIENNFKLLKVLGIPIVYPDFNSLFSSGKQHKAVLHPTASTPLKYYPKMFWVEIINYLADKDFEIFLLSGNAEEEQVFCQETLRLTPAKATIQYHDGMTLMGVAKHIASAQLFIGSDSALMHLAGLLDTFTVALWSFADFRRIYPYGNFSHVYIPEEVLDAKRFLYPKKKLAWLNRANVQDVVAIIEGSKQESFSLRPKFKSPVKFYQY